jgi:hypothetical protein
MIAPPTLARLQPERLMQKRIAPLLAVAAPHRQLENQNTRKVTHAETRGAQILREAIGAHDLHFDLSAIDRVGAAL